MLNAAIANDLKAQLDEAFTGYGHNKDATILIRKVVNLSEAQTSSQLIQAGINRFRKSYLNKRQGISSTEESKQQ